MVGLVVIWTVLLAVSMPLGAAVAARVPARELTDDDRIVLAAWFGLLGLGWLLLLLSVFVPLQTAITVPVILVVAVGSAASGGLQYLRESLPASRAGTVVPLAVGAAAFSSDLVTHYDTGLYQYQLARWLGVHGAVPGLAHVHDRFGFTSTWTALSGPFTVGPLEGRGASILSGLVILIVLVHTTTTVRRWMAGDRRPGDVFLIVAYATVSAVLWVGDLLLGMTPDVAIGYLVVVTAWLMLRSDALLPSLTLATLALPLKASFAPAFLVLAAVWLVRRRSVSRTLQLSAAGAVALLPVVGVNLVTSGCVLFPLAASCLDLSWAVSPEVASSATAAISDWARWDGLPPPGAGPWAWLTPWLADRPLFAIPEALLLLGVPLSIVALWRTGGYGHSIVVLAMSWVGWLYAFATAPSFRFTFPFLVLFWAWIAERAANRLFEDRSPLRVSVPVPVVAMLLGSALAVFGLVNVDQAAVSTPSATAGELSVQARLLRPPHLNLHLVEGSMAELVPSFERATSSLRLREETAPFPHLVPEQSDQCWSAPIPCAPDPIDADVELRRPTRIGDGFRTATDP